MLTLLLKDLLIKRGKSKVTARIFSLIMWHNKDTNCRNKEDCRTGGKGKLNNQYWV